MGVAGRQRPLLFAGSGSGFVPMNGSELRLELEAEQQTDSVQENAYLIDTLDFAPQLVITFVPEPTTLTLAALSLCLVATRRRR
jgi:hypothetical protein